MLGFNNLLDRHPKVFMELLTYGIAHKFAVNKFVTSLYHST